MKKETLYLKLFIILVAFVAGYFLFSANESDEIADDVVETKNHEIEEFGFIFDELTDYVDVSQEEVIKDVLVSKTYIHKDDFANLPPTGSLTEGPPGISIYVVKKPDAFLEWIEETPLLGPRMSETEYISIGANEFTFFESDGLYVSDVYLLQQNKFMLVVTASWRDRNDIQRNDAKNLLRTLKLVAPQSSVQTKHDYITVSYPKPMDKIKTPLVIEGEARGFWYFEATFPITLTDWDGRIIKESFATADGEWMTEDFVPFNASLDFVSPYKKGDPDFMKRGSLILHRSNASGLPEHDDYFEIPITFAR